MGRRIKYQMIIFDLDDTLFDYTRTERAALKKACEFFNLQYSPENTYGIYKTANYEAHASYTSLVTLEEFTSFRIRRAEIFLNLITAPSIIDPSQFSSQILKNSKTGILINGVYKTIKILFHKVLMVIGTNGTNYPRKDKFENSRIKSFIDGFYSSEELGFNKPNPIFFDLIIDKYCIDKKKVLSVGDSISTDINGAKNAGIDACLFNFRKYDIPQKFPQNVKIIDRFSDLLPILTNTAL